MSTPPLSHPAYRRAIDDGLVLRWSTPADTEGLARLYSHVFRDSPEAPPNRFVASWARDLMSGRHPLITPGDFALVEDTARDAIVAATCLLSQVWEYAGIPFPIGRPEIVASDPGYRNRGLIRAIFELIHARSAALGHLAQGITGIPFYYRQFGYEYALDLGGRRSVYFAAIPRLKEDQAEPYRLRPATAEDLPWVLRLYDRERSRGLVSTRIDERYWRFTLDGFGPESSSAEAWRTQIIVDTAQQPVGYVLTGLRRWGTALPVFGLAVEPGVSLLAVLPSVLRALEPQATSLLTSKPDAPPPEMISFVLGRTHPVYDALGEVRAFKHEPPYAWYVRVPDLPALIRHIAPALEQRLADSLAAGHSGELRLDFYRGGLRLAFEGGRLMVAEDWRAPVWGTRPQAGFPPLVFLQLLFGYRSLAELRHAFPDVWADDEVAPLLETLFPAQPSWVLPLD